MNHMKHAVRIILLVIILYLTLGAIVPFLIHPKISEETIRRTAQTEYFGQGDSGERVAVLSDNGEALAHRIRMISQAKERIILSTFDFRPDIAGRQVLAALHDAAARGVRVQVLVDGISGLLRMERNPEFYALSAQPTAEVRLYNPVRPWLPWTLMGRLHDKYFVVDDQAYILGGRNTYSFFLGDQEGYKNYDWDALVYCDTAHPSLDQVVDYFHSVWDGGSCKVFHNDPKLLRKQSVANAARDLAQLYAQMEQDHPDWFTPIDYRSITAPAGKITLMSNPIGLYSKEPVVYYQLTQLFSQAKEEVFFHTPYIICNRWMLDQLAMVCGRVPQVTMLTNSVANNGNFFGAMDYWANKQKVLDTGLQVLEYDSGISYHGKCAAVDDRLALIGSFNFDMRSAYLDTELMLVIDSPQVNQSLREKMAVYEDEALRVDDLHHSTAPDGITAQEIPASKAVMMAVFRVLGGWARFLF